MRGHQAVIATLVAVVVVGLGAATASATLTETSNTYTWKDGQTYTYSYAYDDLSWTSFERLDLVSEDGSTTLVASLISDADGNWTGMLNGVAYADQYEEAVGDYVVVMGYDTWPTWQDFDAALQAIGFWDGAVTIDIVYNSGGIYYDTGIMIYTLSATESGSGGGGSTQTHAYGTQNALTRVLKHADYHARVRLLQNLSAGRGTPSPTTGSHSGK